MTASRFTYGDMLAVGYLLSEFNHDAAAALDFCEKYGVAAEICVLLREAKRRSHRHEILPRRVSRNDA